MYQKLELRAPSSRKIHLLNTERLREGVRFLDMVDFSDDAVRAVNHLISIGCSRIDRMGTSVSTASEILLFPLLTKCF